jgi:hypothetical protein
MKISMLLLIAALLCGCGAGWYNPGKYPYVSANDQGTPSDRTGGARAEKVPDPAYPPPESAK